MKVKIFVDDRPEKLEQKLNQWLEDNFWVKIRQITQSSSEKISISIWYEEPDVPILG